MKYIHVIDADVARRGRVSRIVFGAGYHAEIYENAEEIQIDRALDGLILIADDQNSQALQRVQTAIEDSTTFLPMLVYASDPSPNQIVRAMLCGSFNYLAWPFTSAELQDAVNGLFGHEHVIEVAKRENRSRRLVAKLSPRETEVLAELIAGESNKQIGALLRISPRTVENHRANLMAKLAAKSTADAVRIGVYAGLDTAGAKEPNFSGAVAPEQSKRAQPTSANPLSTAVFACAEAHN